MTHSYYRFVQSLFGGIVVLAICGRTLAAAAPEAPAAVELSMPLLGLQGEGVVAVKAGKPATPAVADGRLRLAVTVAGRSEPILLPMAADTYVCKDQDKSFGTAEVLAVGAGDANMTLLKPDMTALAGIKPADIRDARLTFTVGWKAKDGAATFTAYRMLTEWSEAATWLSPRPGAQWKGPRTQVDYDKTPLATWKVEAVKPGPAAMEGLADAVRNWTSGQWPALGILVRMSGSTGQINLLSSKREEKLQAVDEATKANPAVIRLGGSAATALATLNIAQLRSAVLSPDDVKSAELHLKVMGKTKDVATTTLSVYKLRIDPSQWHADQELTAGRDFDAKPLGTLSLATVPEDNWLKIPVAASALQQMMQADHGSGLLLTLTPPIAGKLDLATSRYKAATLLPLLRIAVAHHENHLLFQAPVVPTPGVFTHVKDGHFDYGGQRLRLWGVAMGARPNPEMADRLHKMGFNAVRLWGPTKFYDKDPDSGKPAVVSKGDGSKTDEYDRLFAAFKQQGMFVNCTALMEAGPVSTSDTSWLRPIGGDDWEQWKAAYTSKTLDGSTKSFAPAFDERLMAARKRQIADFLAHVNPYTGKSYAQEEAIALHELGNERAFMKRLLEKGFDKWPDYFRAKFQRRWTDWLVKQYRDDAGLKAAWGPLAGNESLAAGTVKLAPTLEQRNQYPAARASDFIHFITDVIYGYNKELETYARSQAPAGVGVAVVPFSYDTQFQPNLPWLYTAAQGDVANFGMYFWTLSSALTAPPSMYVMDSHTVAGKPTVIYETNVGRPNPFRAELPLRVAALAGWQDWDAVFWHYFYGQTGPSPVPDEQYQISPAKYMAENFYWTAVEFETDPVLHSAIATAGQMFLRGSISPAPHPATYVVGRDALYGYQYFNGLSMGRATFSRGARIRFAPEQKGGLFIQDIDESELNGRIRGAVASGQQILWDWPKARLIIDTPTAKAYVGRSDGLYRFKDGIVVGEFSTPFVSFAMVSGDGRPLTGDDPSRRIYLSAVSDARNSGFSMDLSIAKPDGMFLDPAGQAKAIQSRGTAPVIQDPVKFRLWWPRQLQGRLSGYDFALRKTLESKVDTNLLEHNGTPLWMAVLDIDQYGKPAVVPVVAAAPSAVADADPKAPGATTRRTSGAPLDDVWNPLPNLSWSDGYYRAHQVLRDGSFLVSRISDQDKTKAADKVITLTEAEILFNAPANIQVYFHDDHMTHIDATFTRPPALRELVADLERKWGPAAQKILAETADKTSTVRWGIGSGKTQLNVVVGETQGTLSISYVAGGQ